LENSSFFLQNYGANIGANTKNIANMQDSDLYCWGDWNDWRPYSKSKLNLESNSSGMFAS